MSHRHGHDPAKEIEIFLAFHVPHELHAGVVRHKRVGVVGAYGGEKIFAVFRYDFVFVHER
jgi:hypothetical protein